MLKRLQHLPWVVLLLSSSWVALLLSSVWTPVSTQSCTGGDEPPRDVVLAWFKDRVLQGLGLQRPPVPGVQGPDGDTARSDARQRHTRASRVHRVDQHHHRHHQPSQELTEYIVFPTSSSCFTYYFEPSLNSRESLVTSAHFWFYAGEGATSDSPSPLFILTAEEQQLLQVATAPSWATSDGWVTYHLERDLQASLSEGPFVLQVRCAACECPANESDKLPFVHLHVAGPRPDRSPRRTAGPIPWSPSAMDLLQQRPTQDRPQHSDCNREDIEINFEELGWDNWIVHPKVLTFQYCVGNCSAWDRVASMLGIKQCCAPVPGTMRDLRITTTSDGGHSFKYQTLPNIIAEECTCI